MIRFIDLDNGIVYNGNRPYIFWFDREQSTQMIYVKKICVLSDVQELHVSIPNNLVFRFLDMSRIDELSDLEINDFTYKNIEQLYTNSFISSGTEYTGLYVHMLYITACSENIGEFHEEFTLDNEQFEIAADFYAERENLKINLSNFGVEIPESIQNAVYDANVHEETKDNVLLNRKYKELLLNYWDIIANVGSYKSLLNSLKWFEYGDLVKLEEIWKHEEWGMNRFNREELNLLLTEKMRSTLANFSKTTHLGLYLALQKYLTVDGEVQYEKLDDITVTSTDGSGSVTTDRKIETDIDQDLLLDDEDVDIDQPNYQGLIGEMTPKLKNKLFKWSVEDLSLKMYLLGSFYESYFVPIHLDVIHSTIESIVFTNTIKCLNAHYMDRFDYMIDVDSFTCSVKDNSVYKLYDVEVQGYDDPRYHISVPNNDNIINTDMVNVYDRDTLDDNYPEDFIFGVTYDKVGSMKHDDEDSSDDTVNNRLKTYYLNRYNGIGVVIPFNCILHVEEDDFVNQETILVTNGDITRTLNKHTLYPYVQGKIEIKFNLLLTKEGENTITLYFSTAGGRSYIKTLHVTVVGDTRCNIKLYKVKSNKVLKGLNVNDYNDELSSNGYLNEFMKYVRPYNLYMYTHNRYVGDISEAEHPLPEFYQTFIPGVTQCGKDDDGVKYNRVIIFDSEALEHLSDTEIGELQSLFNVAKREIRDPNTETIIKTYYTLVSKSFVNDWDDDTKSKMDSIQQSLYGYVVRSSDGYFFQHHHLVELGACQESCQLGDDISYYTVTDKDTLCVVPDLKYSNVTYQETEWVFRNVSTAVPYEITMHSIKEPFVNDNVKSKLLPGFYDVIFRYRLDNGKEMEEVHLKSAFRKV